MLNKKLFQSMIVLALSVSPTAFAESWYAGAGLGAISSSGDYTQRNLPVDEDPGWKIFAGYRFNTNVAAELTYTNLGTLTGTGRFFGTPYTDELEATAISVSAVGFLPVSDNFSFIGRLGIFSWDADDTVTFGSSASASDSGTGVNVGLGVQYEFTKQVGARIEWDRFGDVGEDTTTGQVTINLFAASLFYNF